MNARRVQALALAGVLASAAILLYRFPPEHFHFYPVCPIQAWTGLLCPGCGGTRALAALTHGNLEEAFHWNPLLTLLLPALTIYLALAIRSGHWPELRPSAIHALLIATVLFTIFRNIT